MSAVIQRALQALRDVDGVHGSFVLRRTGELVGKDLPAVFHDQLFEEVGARLSRFIETLAADGDEVSSAVLRFEEHRLHVVRFGQGLLAVITSNDINTAALRMALTLTTRKLEPELQGAFTQPPPSVQPAPSAAPPSVRAPVQPATTGRTYRGRLIG